MKAKTTARAPQVSTRHAARKFLAVVWLLALALLTPWAPTASGAQQSAAPASASSPQSAPAQPTLTLGELEQMAAKQNPTFAQAEAAIRAAEGRRQQAGLLPNPVLGYQGEEFAFRAFSNKAEHLFFFEQEIPLGGKLRKSKTVFEKEKQQITADADAERQRVVNAVRLLYYRALGAQQLVETKRQLAQLHTEAVGVTEELMNIGQADLPDQLDIEIEAQRADLALVQAENEQAQIWQLLAAVVGNPQLPVARLAGDLETSIPQLDRQQMTAFLLQESPEIKAARVAVERAEAVIARAKAERAPDMIVRGGFGYNTERLELGDAPFPRRTGPEANIEIGFRVPLFNRNQGNIAAAEADLAGAEANLRRVELSLRARLAAAFTNYENARRIVSSYQQNILPRARRSYELFLTKFNQMAAAYPQALVARRSYLRAQVEYTEALVALWQNGLSIQGFLLNGATRMPNNQGSDGDDR